MCTLIVLHRPRHRWPVLIGANRDELRKRRWQAPGRHWPDRPDTLGGLDEEAGGSWLARNDSDVFAVILNRRGSLGPADGFRTRGDIVLSAVENPTARSAARAISRLDGNRWRSFNLVIADSREVIWVRNQTPAGIVPMEVPEGLSMLTSLERNDPGCVRTARYLPRLADREAPDPARGDWDSWQDILADTTHPPDDPLAAMTIHSPDYGTVSSSLVAIPAGDSGDRARWRFAPGPPDRTPYTGVDPGP